MVRNFEYRLYAFIILNIFISIISVFFSSLSLIAAGIILNLIYFFAIKESTKKEIQIFTMLICIGMFFVLTTYVLAELEFGIPYYQNDDVISEARMIGNEYLWALNPLTSIPKMYINGVYAPTHIWVLIAIKKFSDIFTGYHTLIPRFLNIYLLLFLALKLKTITETRFNFDKEKSLFLVKVIMLFPNILFASAFVYRDVIAIYLFVIAIYLTVMLPKTYLRMIVNFIKLLMILFLLFFTRESMTIIFAVIYIYINLRKNNLNILVFIILFFSLIIIDMANGFLIVNNFIDALIGEQQEWFNFYNDKDLGNFSRIFHSAKLFPFGFVIKMIGGIVLGLYNFKLVIESNSVFAVFHLLNGIMFIFIIFSLPIVVKRIAKLSYLSFTLVLFYLAYSLITYNFRHLMYFLVFYSILFADSYLENKRKKVAKSYYSNQHYQDENCAHKELDT